MTLSLHTNQERHRLWLAMRLGQGAAAFPDACGIIGVDKDGDIAASAVYTGYTRFDNGRAICAMNVAALPGVLWCLRPVIEALLSYPFDTIGVSALQASCKRENAKAQDFLRRLGFKRTGALRLGCGKTQDLIIFDMLPNEAKKWLGYVPTAWREAQ